MNKGRVNAKYEDKYIKSNRTFPTGNTVLLVIIIAIQIGLIILGCAYQPKPQDVIHQYNVTVDPQEDGSLGETEPIPAPRENQHIRFFNMDKLSEIETLITGEKNGQVGYAIYRIMDGAMVNLFGEGMEDCC